MMTIKELKAKLEEVDRLDKLSDELDFAGREEESMMEYHKMWEIVNQIARALTQATNGAIPYARAQGMCFHSRDKLIAICEKHA